jgi:hypothetical protein
MIMQARASLLKLPGFERLQGAFILTIQASSIELQARFVLIRLVSNTSCGLYRQACEYIFSPQTTGFLYSRAENSREPGAYIAGAKLWWVYAYTDRSKGRLRLLALNNFFWFGGFGVRVWWGMTFIVEVGAFDSG